MKRASCRSVGERRSGQSARPSAKTAAPVTTRDRENERQCLRARRAATAPRPASRTVAAAAAPSVHARSTARCVHRRLTSARMIAARAVARSLSRSLPAVPLMHILRRFRSLEPLKDSMDSMSTSYITGSTIALLPPDHTLPPRAPPTWPASPSCHSRCRSSCSFASAVRRLPPRTDSSRVIPAAKLFDGRSRRIRLPDIDINCHSRSGRPDVAGRQTVDPGRRHVTPGGDPCGTPAASTTAAAPGPASGISPISTANGTKAGFSGNRFHWLSKSEANISSRPRSTVCSVERRRAAREPRRAPFALPDRSDDGTAPHGRLRARRLDSGRDGRWDGARRPRRA